MSSNRYFACLWRGTDLPDYSADKYGKQDVENLHKGIKRVDPNGYLTMLVDDYYQPVVSDLGIKHVLFSGADCGGWSKVLEIFHPSLRPQGKERCLAVGLDTIFISDPSWLFKWGKSPVGLPWDPYNKNKEVCDAVIQYNAEGAAIVWDFYQEQLKVEMENHRMGNHPSEMILLRDLFKRHKWQPLERDGHKLKSYKAHVRRNGHNHRDATLVYFHGKPKPIDLPEGDLKEIWNDNQ